MKKINIKIPIVWVVLITFLFNTLISEPVFADLPFLPSPGKMVNLTPSFAPPLIRGIKIFKDNPFKFEFIMSEGDNTRNFSSENNNSLLKQYFLKKEADTLVKYFLASLTTPEKDMWVNLSPYERNHIAPTEFGLTEMGKELLAQDYLLKQLTASVMYPEGNVGHEFWKKIYDEAYKRFGTTNISVSTFNRVWIVPDKAVVFENARNNTAVILKSSLKVMLEEDYLSLKKHSLAEIPKKSELNVLSSQIIREIIIPVLQKEVNTGKNFANLRQIYNSLILASWYKSKLKQSLISQGYVNRNKPGGIDVKDKGIDEKIFTQYLKSYKKGVYNYIKEEITPANEPIQRKYFSGGFALGSTATILQLKEGTQQAMLASKILNGLRTHLFMVPVVLAATLSAFGAQAATTPAHDIFQTKGAQIVETFAVQHPAAHVFTANFNDSSRIVGASNVISDKFNIQLGPGGIDELREAGYLTFGNHQVTLNFDGIRSAAEQAPRPTPAVSLTPDAANQKIGTVGQNGNSVSRVLSNAGLNAGKLLSSGRVSVIEHTTGKIRSDKLDLVYRGDVVIIDLDHATHQQLPSVPAIERRVPAAQPAPPAVEAARPALTGQAVVKPAETRQPEVQPLPPNNVVPNHVLESGLLRQALDHTPNNTAALDELHLRIDQIKELIKGPAISAHDRQLLIRELGISTRYEHLMKLLSFGPIENQPYRVIYSAKAGEEYKILKTFQTKKEFTDFLTRFSTDGKFFKVLAPQQGPLEISKLFNGTDFNEVTSPKEVEQMTDDGRNYFAYASGRDADGNVLEGVVAGGLRAALDKVEYMKAIKSSAEVLNTINQSISRLTTNDHGLIIGAYIARDDNGLIQRNIKFITRDDIKEGVEKMPDGTTRVVMRINIDGRWVPLKTFHFGNSPFLELSIMQPSEEDLLKDPIKYKMAFDSDNYSKVDRLSRGEIVLGDNWTAIEDTKLHLMRVAATKNEELNELSLQDAKRRGMLQFLLAPLNIGLSVVAPTIPVPLNPAADLLYKVFYKSPISQLGPPTIDDVVEKELAPWWLSEKQSKDPNYLQGRSWSNLTPQEKSNLKAEAITVLQKVMLPEPEMTKLYHYLEARKSDAEASYLLEVVSNILNIAGTLEGGLNTHLVASNPASYFAGPYKVLVEYQAPRNQALALLLSNSGWLLTGQLPIPQAIYTAITGNQMPFIPVNKLAAPGNIGFKIANYVAPVLDLKSVINEAFTLTHPESNPTELPFVNSPQHIRLNFYIAGIDLKEILYALDIDERLEVQLKKIFENPNYMGYVTKDHLILSEAIGLDENGIEGLFYSATNIKIPLQTTINGVNVPIYLIIDPKTKEYQILVLTKRGIDAKLKIIAQQRENDQQFLRMFGESGVRTDVTTQSGTPLQWSYNGLRRSIGGESKFGNFAFSWDNFQSNYLYMLSGQRQFSDETLKFFESIYDNQIKIYGHFRGIPNLFFASTGTNAVSEGDVASTAAYVLQLINDRNSFHNQTPKTEAMIKDMSDWLASQQQGDGGFKQGTTEPLEVAAWSYSALLRSGHTREASKALAFAHANIDPKTGLLFNNSGRTEITADATLRWFAALGPEGTLSLLYGNDTNRYVTAWRNLINKFELKDGVVDSTFSKKFVLMDNLDADGSQHRLQVGERIGDTEVTANTIGRLREHQVLLESLGETWMSSHIRALSAALKDMQGSRNSIPSSTAPDHDSGLGFEYAGRDSLAAITEKWLSVDAPAPVNPLLGTNLRPNTFSPFAMPTQALSRDAQVGNTFTAGEKARTQTIDLADMLIERNTLENNQRAGRITPAQQKRLDFLAKTLGQAHLEYALPNFREINFVNAQGDLEHRVIYDSYERISKAEKIAQQQAIDAENYSKALNGQGIFYNGAVILNHFSRVGNRLGLGMPIRSAQGSLFHGADMQKRVFTAIHQLPITERQRIVSKQFANFVIKLDLGTPHKPNIQEVMVTIVFPMDKPIIDTISTDNDIDVYVNGHLKVKVTPDEVVVPRYNNLWVQTSAERFPNPLGYDTRPTNAVAYVAQVQKILKEKHLPISGFNITDYYHYVDPHSIDNLNPNSYRLGQFVLNQDGSIAHEDMGLNPQYNRRVTVQTISVPVRGPNGDVISEEVRNNGTELDLPDLTLDQSIKRMQHPVKGDLITTATASSSPDRRTTTVNAHSVLFDTDYQFTIDDVHSGHKLNQSTVDVLVFADGQEQHIKGFAKYLYSPQFFGGYLPYATLLYNPDTGELLAEILTTNFDPKTRRMTGQATDHTKGDAKTTYVWDWRWEQPISQSNDLRTTNTTYNRNATSSTGVTTTNDPTNEVTSTQTQNYDPTKHQWIGDSTVFLQFKAPDSPENIPLRHENSISSAQGRLLQLDTNGKVRAVPSYNLNGTEDGRHSWLFENGGFTNPFHNYSNYSWNAGNLTFTVDLGSPLAHQETLDTVGRSRFEFKGKKDAHLLVTEAKAYRGNTEDLTSTNVFVNDGSFRFQEGEFLKFDSSKFSQDLGKLKDLITAIASDLNEPVPEINTINAGIKWLNDETLLLRLLHSSVGVNNLDIETKSLIQEILASHHVESLDNLTSDQLIALAKTKQGQKLTRYLLANKYPDKVSKALNVPRYTVNINGTQHDPNNTSSWIQTATTTPVFGLTSSSTFTIGDPLGRPTDTVYSNKSRLIVDSWIHNTNIPSKAHLVNHNGLTTEGTQAGNFISQNGLFLLPVYRSINSPFGTSEQDNTTAFVAGTSIPYFMDDSSEGRTYFDQTKPYQAPLYSVDTSIQSGVRVPAPSEFSVPALINGEEIRVRSLHRTTLEARIKPGIPNTSNTANATNTFEDVMTDTEIDFTKNQQQKLVTTTVDTGGHNLETKAGTIVAPNIGGYNYTTVFDAIKEGDYLTRNKFSYDQGEFVVEAGDFSSVKFQAKEFDNNLDKIKKFIALIAADLSEPVPNIESIDVGINWLNDKTLLIRLLHHLTDTANLNGQTKNLIQDILKDDNVASLADLTEGQLTALSRTEKGELLTRYLLVNQYPLKGPISQYFAFHKTPENTPQRPTTVNNDDVRDTVTSVSTEQNQEPSERIIRPNPIPKNWMPITTQRNPIIHQFNPWAPNMPFQWWTTFDTTNITYNNEDVPRNVTSMSTTSWFSPLGDRVFDHNVGLGVSDNTINGYNYTLPKQTPELMHSLKSVIAQNQMILPVPAIKGKDFLYFYANGLTKNSLTLTLTDKNGVTITISSNPSSPVKFWAPVPDNKIFITKANNPREIITAVSSPVDFRDGNLFVVSIAQLIQANIINADGPITASLNIEGNIPSGALISPLAVLGDGSHEDLSNIETTTIKGIIRGDNGKSVTIRVEDPSGRVNARITNIGPRDDEKVASYSDEWTPTKNFFTSLEYLFSNESQNPELTVFKDPSRPNIALSFWRPSGNELSGIFITYKDEHNGSFVFRFGARNGFESPYTMKYELGYIRPDLPEAIAYGADNIVVFPMGLYNFTGNINANILNKAFEKIADFLSKDRKPGDPKFTLTQGQMDFLSKYSHASAIDDIIKNFPLADQAKAEAHAFWEGRTLSPHQNPQVIINTADLKKFLEEQVAVQHDSASPLIQTTLNTATSDGFNTAEFVPTTQELETIVPALLGHDVGMLEQAKKIMDFYLQKSAQGTIAIADTYNSRNGQAIMFDPNARNAAPSPRSASSQIAFINSLLLLAQTTNDPSYYDYANAAFNLLLMEYNPSIHNLINPDPQISLNPAFLKDPGITGGISETRSNKDQKPIGSIKLLPVNPDTFSTVSNAKFYLLLNKLARDPQLYGALSSKASILLQKQWDFLKSSGLIDKLNQFEADGKTPNLQRGIVPVSLHFLYDLQGMPGENSTEEKRLSQNPWATFDASRWLIEAAIAHGKFVGHPEQITDLISNISLFYHKKITIKGKGEFDGFEPTARSIGTQDKIVPSETAGILFLAKKAGNQQIADQLTDVMKTYLQGNMLPEIISVNPVQTQKPAALGLAAGYPVSGIEYRYLPSQENIWPLSLSSTIEGYFAQEGYSPYGINQAMLAAFAAGYIGVKAAAVIIPKILFRNKRKMARQMAKGEYGTSENDLNFSPELTAIADKRFEKNVLVALRDLEFQGNGTFKKRHLERTVVSDAHMEGLFLFHTKLIRYLVAERVRRATEDGKLRGPNDTVDLLGNNRSLNSIDELMKMLFVLMRQEIAKGDDIQIQGKLEAFLQTYYLRLKYALEKNDFTKFDKIMREIVGDFGREYKPKEKLNQPVITYPYLENVKINKDMIQRFSDYFYPEFTKFVKKQQITAISPKMMEAANYFDRHLILSLTSIMFMAAAAQNENPFTVLMNNFMSYYGYLGYALSLTAAGLLLSSIFLEIKALYNHGRMNATHGRIIGAGLLIVTGIMGFMPALYFEIYALKWLILTSLGAEGLSLINHQLIPTAIKYIKNLPSLSIGKIKDKIYGSDRVKSTKEEAKKYFFESQKSEDRSPHSLIGTSLFFHLKPGITMGPWYMLVNYALYLFISMELASFASQQVNIYNWFSIRYLAGEHFKVAIGTFTYLLLVQYLAPYSIFGWLTFMKSWIGSALGNIYKQGKLLWNRIKGGTLQDNLSYKVKEIKEKLKGKKIGLINYGGNSIVSPVFSAKDQKIEIATNSILKYFYVLKNNGDTSSTITMSKDQARDILNALHKAEKESGLTLFHLIQLNNPDLPENLRITVQDPKEASKVAQGYRLRLYLTEMLAATQNMDIASNLISKAIEVRRFGLGDNFIFYIGHNKYNAPLDANDPSKIYKNNIEIEQRDKLAMLIHQILGSFEFSIDEFNNTSKSPDDLIQTLINDSINVPQGNDPIQQLNDLLSDKSIYKSLVGKIPEKEMTPDISRLINLIENGKAEIEDVRHLNRILIETAYPKITPKSSPKAEVQYVHTHFGMKSGGMNSYELSDESKNLYALFVEDRNATTLFLDKWINDLSNIVKDDDLAIIVANRNTTYMYNPVGEASFLVEQGFTSVGPQKVSTGWGTMQKMLNAIGMHAYKNSPVMPLSPAAAKIQRENGASTWDRFYNNFFGLVGFSTNSTGQSEDYQSLMATVHTMIAMGADPKYALSEALWTKKRETNNMGPWAAAPVRWSAGRLQTINDYLMQNLNELGPESSFARDYNINNGRFYITMPLALLTVTLAPLLIFLDLTPFQGIQGIFWIFGFGAAQVLALHGVLATLRHKGFNKITSVIGAGLAGLAAFYFYPAIVASLGINSMPLVVAGASFLGSIFGGFITGFAQSISLLVRNILLFAPRIVIERGGQKKGHKGISFEFTMSGAAGDTEFTPFASLGFFYDQNSKRIKIFTNITKNTVPISLFDAIDTIKGKELDPLFTGKNAWWKEATSSKTVTLTKDINFEDQKTLDQIKEITGEAHYDKFMSILKLASGYKKHLDVSTINYSILLGTLVTGLNLLVILKLDLMNAILLLPTLLFTTGMAIGPIMMKKKIGNENILGSVSKLLGFAIGASFLTAISVGIRNYVSGSINISDALFVSTTFLLAILTNVSPLLREYFAWTKYRDIEEKNVDFDLLGKSFDYKKHLKEANQRLKEYTGLTKEELKKFKEENKKINEENEKLKMAGQLPLKVKDDYPTNKSEAIKEAVNKSINEAKPSKLARFLFLGNFLLPDNKEDKPSKLAKLLFLGNSARNTSELARGFWAAIITLSWFAIVAIPPMLVISLAEYKFAISTDLALTLLLQLTGVFAVIILTGKLVNLIQNKYWNGLKIWKNKWIWQGKIKQLEDKVEKKFPLDSTEGNYSSTRNRIESLMLAINILNNQESYGKLRNAYNDVNRLLDSGDLTNILPKRDVITTPIAPSPQTEDNAMSTKPFKDMAQAAFNYPSNRIAESIFTNIHPASANSPGGIDFSRVSVDVKSTGESIQTAFDDPSILRLLLNSDGLTPIINDIKVMTPSMMNQFVGLN